MINQEQNLSHPESLAPNAATEGGTGAVGYSHRSNERFQYYSPNGKHSQEELVRLMQELRDHPEAQAARRLQLKVNLGQPYASETILGFELEGRVPFGDVHPDISDPVSAIWYGSNQNRTHMYRNQEHRDGFNHRTGLNDEVVTATREREAMLSASRDALLSEHPTFRLHQTVPPHLVPRAYELWNESFGWSPESIDALMAVAADPESGTYIAANEDIDTGELATLCFASCQNYTVMSNGQEYHLPVFELTDLITAERHRGRGSATAAMLGLISQISADHDHPVFIAECNVIAGTGRLLARLGFTTNPDTQGATRLLSEHVTVGDRKELFSPEQIEVLFQEVSPTVLSQATLGEISSLRDFVVMYLPWTQLEELRVRILRELEIYQLGGGRA